MIRTIYLFSVLILLGCFATPASSQDDFSVKGLDDVAEQASPAASTSAPAVGGAESGEKSLLTLIQEGGWAIYPLGIMLVAVLALAIFLCIDIATKNFAPQPLSAQLDQAMQNGDIAQGIQVASASPTCLGQVMAGALEFVSKRGEHVLDGDSIYDLMADSSLIFNRDRATTVGYLSIISQAAPMLGLLGTVSGMIKAFATLGSGGMGDPAKLAANISEALVTTASGLVIALPAVFLYFIFKNRLSKFVSITELEASRLLNVLRDTLVAANWEQQQAAQEQEA